MIVVDTNIITYLYLPTKFTELAEALLEKDPHWIAPVLWISEFRNVLAFYLRQNIIQLDEALSIIQEAEHLLSDNEYRISSLAVMNLVSQSECSAYDCEYVALAEQTNSILVTQDKKILRNFSQISYSLTSLPDFLI